jgi:hypothetical protein
MGNLITYKKEVYEIAIEIEFLKGKRKEIEIELNKLKDLQRTLMIKVGNVDKETMKKLKEKYNYLNKIGNNNFYI